VKQNNANIGLYIFTMEYPDIILSGASRHIGHQVMNGFCL
jgi:hypothetical protein